MYFYSCHKHKDCAVIYDSLSCPICNKESEYGSIEEMEVNISNLEEDLAEKTAALTRIKRILNNE